MQTFTHKTIETETKKIPVFADGAFIAGKFTYKGMRKVGYKVVLFTYDVNHYSDGYKDAMLISQKTLKTVINK